MQALRHQGLRFAVVFAESLEGASGACMAAWQRLALPCVGAMREKPGGLMGPGHRLRDTTWSPFARVCSTGDTDSR
jgi:hypothetical protein